MLPLCGATPHPPKEGNRHFVTAHPSSGGGGGSQHSGGDFKGGEGLGRGLHTLPVFHFISEFILSMQLAAVAEQLAKAALAKAGSLAVGLSKDAVAELKQFHALVAKLAAHHRQLPTNHCR